MTSSTWRFFRIALLVTGKGEEQFLPKLFRSLEAEGHCVFRVARRIPQLRPITSARKKEKMVGSGKLIPDKDEEIALSARRYYPGNKEGHIPTRSASEGPMKSSESRRGSPWDD